MKISKFLFTCQFLLTNFENLILRGLETVEIKVDQENDIQYVHMEDPSASEITFVRAPCPSKEVMYVRCAGLGT